MVIHDDTDMGAVVREAVAAIEEIARHVGKADRGMSLEQIGEVQTAIALLQSALDLKRRMNEEI